MSTVIAVPIFNFILGEIIAIIMVNMIQINLPHIVRIVDEGAAYDAGLQEGDQIISLNGEKIYLYEELLLFNRINGSNPVEMKFKRGDQIIVTTLTPKLNEETGGYLLGIGCGGTAEETGLGRLKYAWYEMRFCVKQTYKSLGLLVQGKVKSDELAGPVGIAVNVVGKTYDAAKEIGWSTVLVNMLNITLLLSINLGILNLLPLPALDGGRLVFLVIEVIRGKPVPPEKEGMVHFVGLMFFMGLMIFVMFNDIKNIFG